MRRILVTHDFKSVTVYVDKEGMMLGVPSGISKKYDIASLDLIFTIKPPYGDIETESFLMMLLNKCYVEECKDDDITSIEKYYQVRGYARATKSLKMVDVYWSESGGYSFTPTQNARKLGFRLLNDKTLKVPANFSKGDLGKAFLEAVKLSV
jgi:hypothetical protein